MPDLLIGLSVGFAALVVWRTATVRRLKVITVIDGDTFMAVSQQGKRYKLRLYGCDCPEVGQRYAHEASQAVKDLVGGKWVKVRLRGRDRYRRHLASVRTPGGADLCKELLKQGLAFPLPGKFSWAAAGARLRRKGVWSGFFNASKPWEASTRQRPGLLRTLGRLLGARR